MAAPRTIHDFGPLSPELFEMQYPAPGSPDLARRVQSLLSPHPVALDEDWGLDHGAWTVLSKAYPDADIPVVQLSIDGTRPMSWHYGLANRLRPLRDEGVLIMASGNIVHNLRVMEWSEDAEPHDWAVRFADHIISSIENGDHASVHNYSDQGQDSALSVPHEDHYAPIAYALGATDKTDAVRVMSNYLQFKSISMASFVFSPTSIL